MHGGRKGNMMVEILGILVIGLVIGFLAGIVFTNGQHDD